jgi:hypothetical protein
MKARIPFIALAVAFAGGCAKPPPPAAPPAEAKAEPAPPAPPPKCEKLSEACAATADTRVGVGASWSMAPPASWTYAKENDATVARIDGAALAVTVYDGRDKKTAPKQRDDAFNALTTKIGVKLAKKMAWPAKPARVVNELALYQVEGSTQEGKAGALLVFVGRVPSEETPIGVGFVVESDAKDSDKAILTGVESLKAQKSADKSGEAK